MKRVFVTMLITLLVAGTSLAKTVDYYFHYEIDGKSVAITKIILNKEVKPGDHLMFFIDSPGGLVSESLTLYDYLIELRHRGVQVDTIGTGMCASGATIVLQAGETRYLTPFSLFLIHRCSVHPEYEPYIDLPWFHPWFLNYAIYLAEVKYINWENRYANAYIDDNMIDIYLCRTHLPRKVIENMLTGDCWIHPVDAKQLGFCDRIYNAGFIGR